MLIHAGVVALRRAAFGQGTGSIIEIYCWSYDAQTVTDCDIYTGYGFCTDHRRDAGVRCCE